MHHILARIEADFAILRDDIMVGQCELLICWTGSHRSYATSGHGRNLEAAAKPRIT